MSVIVPAKATKMSALFLKSGGRHKRANGQAKTYQQSFYQSTEATEPKRSPPSFQQRC
jgi:hypothetical protein